MSIFDEERKKLGLPTVGGSTSAPAKSIFDAERQQILSGQTSNAEPVATPSQSAENAQYSDMMKAAFQSNPDAFTNPTGERLATPQQAADNKQYADVMKASFQQNPGAFTEKTPKLFTPDENILQKALDVIGLPSRYIAAHMVPNAPLIGYREDGSYGELPGTNAQGAYNAANPVPTTGNQFIDKAGDAFGSLVGPAVGTMGTGIGSIPTIIDSGLAQAGINLGKVSGGIVKTALAGYPLNVAATLATSDPSLSDLAKAGNEGALIGGALGGAGGAIGAASSKAVSALADKYAGTKLGDALSRFTAKPVAETPPEVQQAQQETQRIYNTYKSPAGPKTLDNVTKSIMDEVSQRTTPPLENPKLLDKYLQTHLPDVPKSEFDGLDYNAKSELAQYIRDGLDTHDMATKIAAERGYNWNELSQKSAVQEQSPNQSTTFKTSKGSTYTVGENGTTQRTKSLHEGHNPNDVGLKQASDATVYVDKNEATRIGSHFGMNKEARPKIVVRDDGIYLVSWNPKENRWGLNGKPISYTKTPEVGRSPVEFWQLKQDQELGTTASKVHAGNEITEVSNSTPSFRSTETPAQASEPVPATVTRANEVKPAKTTEGMRERGFTQTVRTSDMTPESIKPAFEQPELYKTRSTQKLFDDAQSFISKNGQQSAYDFVMKANKMTDKHNAVAQILSKQFANSGDVSRAIDVVSKTAKSGTELGRAIQALSLWNRMDTDGALLLAQRQINKGNVGEYRSLTPEQAQSVTQAAQKIQEVQQAKNLADEVASIVMGKQPGEKLTDAELATIQQFQKQVNDLQGKVKKFLPGEKEAKPKKVIEEVNKIPPQERTIDQLKDYWDARAERAKRKLAAQKNIGLLPNTENPVLLYAEIGVSKIAKGVLNLADFTDQMVQEVGEKVKPVIQQVYNESVNRFRRSQGLPTSSDLNRLVSKAVKDRQLDPESAAQFKNWASEIAFYTDENIRTEAVQDLQLALKRLEKPTLGNQISSLQAGAQLLSLPTLLRNSIGNEAFNALEKVNKITAVPIDWALSKFTKERSIAFNSNNQESYWRNWFTGGKSGWDGVSPNGKLSSYDIRPELFGERNPLKFIPKMTGAMLQSFDHAAYMRAYGDVLATYAEQLGKSQGMSGNALKEAVPRLIKQLDQSIYDMADEAGKYATFQDDTVLSKAAEAVKKGLNYPTKIFGDAMVNAGVLPERLNPAGFGLGDVVLKYAKTPANIVMRAIDYSPAGMLRGIFQLISHLKTKNYSQRQAVLALSRGITGTLGMTGLGYYLASQGILTGAPSSDYDVKSLNDAAGKKGYQVNLSALQRWIASGLDKSAARFQNGDTLINYDWLQPMAISLAMGVNANEAANSKKAGVSKDTVTVARDALVSGLKTVMNQPLVQGLQQVADATSNLVRYGSWSGFANIFKGVPASFVPALSGQVRNLTDNTARSTYDPNVLKSMVNMVINKIPVAAEKLPPQIESLSGQPREVVDGGQQMTAKQAFNVMVNPAKLTKYNVSPEAAMVVQLINDTGDTRVAPRVPNRYVMVDKKKIDLTPGQYLQLQKDTSQFTAQQLQRITPMLTNPNTPEKTKIDAVIKVLNDAGERARRNLQRDNPELRPQKAR